MTPAEIPSELKALLDRAAGKEHSDQGLVMRSLAEILTRYGQMVRAEVAAELYERAMQKPEGSSFRRHLIAAHQMVNPPTIEDAARAVQEIYGRETRGGA